MDEYDKVIQRIEKRYGIKVAHKQSDVIVNNATWKTAFWIVCLYLFLFYILRVIW